MSAIDLNEAVQSTLTVCRSEWKYVAAMQTELADDLPAVHCFPGELNQVVLNLVVNAAQALGEQGRDEGQGLGNITVRTRRDGPNHVCIEIADDGGGIPRTCSRGSSIRFLRPRAWGRAPAKAWRSAHRVVVEQHAGTLEFTTEAGKGTTFMIRLPIQPTSALPQTPDAPAKHQVPGAAA